jgi:hypothetical protein
MKKILTLLAVCSFTFLACKKKSEDVPAPILEDYSLAGIYKKQDLIKR